LAVTEETVDFPMTLFFKLDEFGFYVLDAEVIDIAVLVPDTPFLTFLPLAAPMTEPWALYIALDLYV